MCTSGVSSNIDRTGVMRLIMSGQVASARKVVGTEEHRLAFISCGGNDILRGRRPAICVPRNGRPLLHARPQRLRRFCTRHSFVPMMSATLPSGTSKSGDLLDKTSPSNSPLGALKDILTGMVELAQPLWGGDRKLIAWLWTLASLLFAFTSTLYAAMLSVIQRTFWNVLNAKEAAKFQKLLAVYFVAVILGPIVIAVFEWLKERLALAWRKALTHHFLSQYLTNRNHYRLTLSAQKVDNPDQRLSEDIMQFTSRAVRFFCVIGVGIFDLGVFSYILYNVYKPLLLTVILYSVIGTGVIAYFGRRLVPLNRLQLSREADFRYNLVRVRECSESIAFYGGEKAEGNELRHRFDEAFRNAIGLLGLKRDISFASNSYRYWAQVIPMAVVAPAYFRGAMPIGAISQMFFSFNHVLSSMGLVVTEFSALAEFSAGVRRLRQLSRALSQGSSKSSAVELAPSKIISDHHQDGAPADMKLTNLSLQTPSRPPRKLVQDLNMYIEAGQRVLVVGSSGVGKSSLLRALCGLWDDGEGTIALPRKSDILFLPQKPFITLGSLRQNVLYPQSDAGVTDEEIEKALAEVNLAHVSERMGGLGASGEQLELRLSLGEQQRLAFARVLFAKPRFFAGDEFTSALDLENERLLYKKLRDLNITYISVGNRPSLLDFHDVVLHLQPEGAWSIETPRMVAERLQTVLDTSSR